MTEEGDVLAVLLLPGPLEGFARERHARGLLSIPRVVALEASRRKPPRFYRDTVCDRQARRLRFPGRLRLLVLYDAAQYPLARALCGRYQDLELWYLPPEPGTRHTADEATQDELARQRAAQVLEATEDDESLRERLRELRVINPRAFLPGDRSQWRKPRLRKPRLRKPRLRKPGYAGPSGCAAKVALAAAAATRSAVLAGAPRPVTATVT